jgi:hypothetical protein
MEKLDIYKAVFLSLISAVASIFVYQLYVAVMNMSVSNIFGTVTKGQLLEMGVASPVVESGQIPGSGQPVTAISIDYDRCRYLRDGKPPVITRDTRALSKTLDIKQESLLLITAATRGRTDIVENHKKKTLFGHLTTKIVVDGKVKGHDSSAVNGDVVCALFSSAMVMQVLEPGKHNIVVVGKFYGNLEETDVNMQYAVLKLSDIPLIHLGKKTDRRSFLPQVGKKKRQQDNKLERLVIDTSVQTVAGSSIEGTTDLNRGTGGGNR